MSDYFRDGYVIARELIDPRVLQEIKQEAVMVFNRIMSLYPEAVTAIGFEDRMIQLFNHDRYAIRYGGKQVQNLISLHELMLRKEILEVVRLLGVREPVINTKPVMFFHNQNLAKSEVYYKTPAHQDYATTQGSINSLVVWLPLAPLFPELGPLEVVPGSHLKGAQWTQIEDNFGMVKTYKDEDFVPMNVTVGDAVFFSTLLVHRSGHNSSQSAIRWAANFRYSDLADPYWTEHRYFHPYDYAPTRAGTISPTAEKVQEWFNL